MRLDPKGELFGHPALKVRDALRDLPSGDWGARTFAWDRHLPSLTEADRRALEAELQEAGFIQQRIESGCYSLTRKGLRLANASGRVYRRKTVERALSGLLARAKAINEGDYAYSVDILVVFGSFLTAAPELGDLDIAYRLRRRSSDESVVDEAKRIVQERGPNRYMSFIEMLDWPEAEVRKKLKGRSPIVSLTPLELHEDMLAKTAHRVVLGEWSPRSQT